MKNVQNKQLFTHDYPLENSYSTLFTAIQFNKIQKEYKWLKFGFCYPLPISNQTICISKETFIEPPPKQNFFGKIPKMSLNK